MSCAYTKSTSPTPLTPLTRHDVRRRTLKCPPTAELRPDARIRFLEGQTHMAHLTDPETFAEQVMSFLRD